MKTILLFSAFLSVAHANFPIRLENAVQTLETSSSRVGNLTAKSIREGSVKALHTCDMSRADFRRALREVPDLNESDFSELKDKDSKVCHTLQDNLQGYQWGNRIYISGEQSNTGLAATLVHEVNHALNHSEENFYDSDLNAFREEYRAFWVESLYKSEVGLLPKKATESSAFCLKLRKKIISLYGLSSLDPDDLPDRPSGRIYPTQENWEKSK